MCVKPRKSNVSGLPSPRCFRLAMACGPNSIKRVFSAWSSSPKRWQIELFFKAMKQNLKLKMFLGPSENAVMTQIWVALITYLILAFLRFKAGLGISFQQMLRLLQINLFDRRNLLDLCTPQPCDDARGQLLRAV